MQLLQETNDGMDLLDRIIAGNARHPDADRRAVHAVAALPMTVTGMRRRSVFHDQFAHIAIGRHEIVNQNRLLYRKVFRSPCRLPAV